MALVERGLGAKRAHAKSHSAVLLMAKCAPDAREGMRVEARGFEAPSVPSARAAPPPAASAVVFVAVVVELDPGARTGSRRSMMTDDSRPNRQLATWRAALQQVAQVFLYGKVKTPPK